MIYLEWSCIFKKEIYSLGEGKVIKFHKKKYNMGSEWIHGNGDKSSWPSRETNLRRILPSELRFVFWWIWYWGELRTRLEFSEMGQTGQKWWVGSPPPNVQSLCSSNDEKISIWSQEQMRQDHSRYGEELRGATWVHQEMPLNWVYKRLT